MLTNNHHSNLPDVRFRQKADSLTIEKVYYERKADARSCSKAEQGLLK